jgi:hypothetical protein
MGVISRCFRPVEKSVFPAKTCNKPAWDIVNRLRGRGGDIHRSAAGAVEKGSKDEMMGPVQLLGILVLTALVLIMAAKLRSSKSVEGDLSEEADFGDEGGRSEDPPVRETEQPLEEGSLWGPESERLIEARPGRSSPMSRSWRAGANSTGFFLIAAYGKCHMAWPSTAKPLPLWNQRRRKAW